MTIKICGLTNLGDAEAALAAGADWLGFVLYPPSPRAMTASEIRVIVDKLPEGVTTVGVFVQPTADEVRRTMAEAGLTLAQLHGATPELMADLSGVPFFQSVALRSSDDLTGFAGHSGRPILVDAPTPQWGGSGKTGDWMLAEQAARLRPILLAGGLTAENVAEAIGQVRPAGVDVSSGIEASKGKKDLELLRAFVQAARQAASAVAP